MGGFSTRTPGNDTRPGARAFGFFCEFFIVQERHIYYISPNSSKEFDWCDLLKLKEFYIYSILLITYENIESNVTINKKMSTGEEVIQVE